MPELILKISKEIGQDRELFREKMLDILDFDFCMVRYYSISNKTDLELTIEGAAKVDRKHVKTALANVANELKKTNRQQLVHLLFPKMKEFLQDDFWGISSVVIGVDSSESSIPEGVIAVKWPQGFPVGNLQRTDSTNFVFSREEINSTNSVLLTESMTKKDDLEVVNCNNVSLREYLKGLAEYHLAAGISFVAIPIVFGSVHSELSHYLTIFCGNINRPIKFNNDSLHKATIISQMVGARFAYEFEDQYRIYMENFLSTMGGLDPHATSSSLVSRQSALDHILPGQYEDISKLFCSGDEKCMEELLKHCCSKSTDKNPFGRALHLSAVALIACGCHYKLFKKLPKITNNSLSVLTFVPMTFDSQKEVAMQFWKVFLSLFPKKGTPAKSNLESILLEENRLTLTFNFQPDVLLNLIAKRVISHDTTAAILDLINLLKCGDLYKEKSIQDFCLVGEKHARLILKKTNNKLILILGL